MKTSDYGVALIKGFEGFRSRPYLCPAGIPTIGYGATYYPDGRKVTLGDHAITEDQADAMLRVMLAPFEREVTGALRVMLEPHEFDALVSFAYNVGIGNFLSSTLLRLVNANDPKGAAEQFLRWDKAGGKRLPGLTARRTAERSLFLGVG